MDYRIIPPEEMIMATANLPLSKSISNRRLIINALATGAGELDDISDCDDTRVIAEALACGDSSIMLENSGTAMRFLTAFFAAKEGSDVVLDGSIRLRERPMKELIEALRQLGADITCTEKEGHAPLHIIGKRLSGGEITMDASISSQFLSALMMVAPGMEKPLTITLEGEIVSRPYILMTLALMKMAGADADFEGQTITINPSVYNKTEPYNEPDWSAASYWYAITALSAGFVTLPLLSTDSLQGDRITAKLFEMLGVNTEPAEETEGLDLAASPEQFSRFETDLSETPDLAQTLAVTAAMLGIPFHLTGLTTLHNKETDRLEALRNELLKFGIVAEIRGGSQIVWNGERIPMFALPVVETYGDHRMAMAFAPAAIYYPGIVIKDADVVTKSYPTFWDELRAAGFTVTDASLPLEEADENAQTEEAED